jgi:hypothetical protein
MYLNAHVIAISRVRKISDFDANEQRRLINEHFTAYLQGDDCPSRWRSLADAANMAETLAEMGLGSGQDADEIIAAGQAALANAWQRAHPTNGRRGTWTLYPNEIEALRWLVTLHTNTQLPACSYGELDTAIKRTCTRIAQAKAGNASPGTVMLEGNFDCTTRERERYSA